MAVIAATLAVTPSAAQQLAPGSLPDGAIALGAPDCADGVVLDDGTLESGYGWVPSVVDGRYIQRFEAADFRSRKMSEICVCWTRNQGDDEVAFQVQLYRDRAGQPARDPVASVEVVATAVPTFPDGAFYSVDVSDLDFHAPTDAFYLGVRWDPSEDQFFFVCVDQTPSTPVVDGWYTDDRANGWANVLDSNDPTFLLHRAMMIRAVALEGYYPLVPDLGTTGRIAMAVLITALGVMLLVRRGRG